MIVIRDRQVLRNRFFSEAASVVAADRLYRYTALVQVRGAREQSGITRLVVSVRG